MTFVGPSVLASKAASADNEIEAHKGTNMNTKLTGGKRSAEHVVKDIRRATRRHFSSEDKIRIVLDGLRGEDSIAELCRKEGIAQSLYYTWSKEFLEAGKRRLAGDTARAATRGEVPDLRRETRALKEAVADLTLENCLLKNVWPAPIARGFYGVLISLRQRIRSHGVSHGQDGDPRIWSPISMPAMFCLKRSPIGSSSGCLCLDAPCSTVPQRSTTKGQCDGSSRRF